MKALPSRLPIVGRDREIEALTKHLDDALAGKGSCVFISGEAGVGKTRLVEEMKEIAAAEGFTVLSSHCLREDFTIYGPFREALKSGRMDYLFMEGTPRVDGVYLITDTGLLAKAATREKNGLDPDLFASMLATVTRFLRDSLDASAEDSQSSSIRRMDYGNRSLLIERGEGAHLVTVLTGRENEFLVEDMREVIEEVCSSYGAILRAWDGDEDRLKDVNALLGPFLVKYDGVDYGEKDPKARRSVLFENVAIGLTRRAKAGPLLLCIEDMQWSDPSTLALLHYVARNVKESGLMILGSFRPEDLIVEGGGRHHLPNAIGKMEEENLIESIDIQRLSERATASLLQSLLEGNVGEGTSRQIYLESEGNPFFVVQMTHWLVCEGALALSNSEWILIRPLESQDIPTRVRDILVNRLNRLEEDRRVVADIASVIGEEFDIGLLARTAMVEETLLMRILAVLENRHRLLRRRGQRCRFDHVKIRDVLYQNIPDELKKTYHGLVGTSIESMYSKSINESSGDAGFHFLRSANPKKALPFLTKAAEQAAKQFANAEAIRFYEDALSVTDDQEGRYRILYEMASISGLVGAMGQLYTTCKEALQFARTESQKADISTMMARALIMQGDYEDGLGILNETLLNVAGTNSCQEASFYNCYGAAYLDSGHYDEAIEYFNKGLAISEKAGDMVLVAGTNHNIGNVLFYRGKYEDALKRYERSKEISERIGHIKFLANHLNGIGIVNLEWANYDTALSYFRQSLVLKEKMGDLSGAALTLGNMAVIFAARDNLEDALRYHQKAQALNEKINNRHSLAVTLNNIALIHEEREEIDLAMGCYEKALRIAEDIGAVGELGIIYSGLASVSCAKGELEKALELGQHGLRINSDTDQKKEIACSHIVLGKIHRARQEWKDAQKELEEGLHILKEIGQAKESADALMELGALFGTLGDATEAKENIQAAIEIFERLEAPRKVQKAKAAYERITSMHVNGVPIHRVS